MQNAYDATSNPSASARALARTREANADALRMHALGVKWTNFDAAELRDEIRHQQLFNVIDDITNAKRRQAKGLWF